MRTKAGTGFLLAAVIGGWAGWCGLDSPAPVLAQEPGTPTEGQLDFARDVQPLFERHCYDCHGPDTQESGLRLSSRKSALAGGDSGRPAIVPGKPDESRLIQLVRGTEEGERMPPEDVSDPLDEREIAVLVRWVSAGAEWPESTDVAAEPTHWAWRKPADPPLPSVSRPDWPKNGIDHFVLAALDREGLAPSPEADRHMLARRVYLDLIGLPPSPEEVEAFVGDTRSDAYERLVDRLLADPAYGERWARMWLDLARYADSKGYGSDPLRTIWRYRDWVIEAFNRNLPYDQFTIEQLAGDLLGSPTPDQVLATAFHRNTMSNDEGGTDDEEFRVAAIKDRIETTMQVWMGVTAGCAKCHSHKFDPLTQREYYQLYAFFNQTEDADRGDEQPKVPTPTRDQTHQLARLEAEVAAIERQLETHTPELASAQTAWEQGFVAVPTRWEMLAPISSQDSAGAALEKLDDHSLLAGGESPATDTYTVVAETAQQGITAVRLEALPHDSLPKGGPGRQADGGNFVLNELRVTALPLGQAAPKARYVRVAIPGERKILSLAEVRVISGGENLARQGQATQSSTDYDGPAALAIDDNTSGEFTAKSVTHTKTERWELDLGRTVDVERLEIFNRTDGGTGGRLAGVRLALLDEGRQRVWETTVAEPPKPSLEIEVGGTPVQLVRPTADFSQEGFPIALAVDGKDTEKSGWAIGPQTGLPHAAVFELAEPLSLEGGARLTFKLVQNYGGGHTIGRFRLSATTTPPPVRELPRTVAEILAVESPQRTDEQAAELAKYYRSIAPELLPLRDQLAARAVELKKLREQVPPTPILRELAGEARRTTRVLLKGNFLTPGDPVEAAVPEAFHPLDGGAADRLGLARWLMDEENPLTSRVAVNRFWAQLFGLGLVETEEDFGTQGMPPSHPELLDWLARRFMDDWDMKALLRLMVTSAAYRQSSTAAPGLLERDPANRLLARGPRARLDAETVRDQALALSGLLSRKIGGPSVYPPQPDGLWRAAFNGDRTWPTSTGEDRYRRGMYTFWRRTVPYPSMAVFDAPSREICTLRRMSTNTPLQSFVTLNDPVYVEAAQALARRIYSAGGSTPADRAAHGLRLCLARPPAPVQVQELVALYESELAHFRGDLAAAGQLATDPLGPLPSHMPANELAAWTVVANVLLNLDGVLSKR